MEEIKISYIFPMKIICSKGGLKVGCTENEGRERE
jgi:hypothetical protein